MSKKFKSAAEILAIQDVQRVEVVVPEWDTSVYVKQLTAGERDEYESSLYELSKAGGRKAIVKQARAMLVAVSCVDEAGARLFSEGQVAALAGKNANAMDRIISAATTLNKIGEAEIVAAAKN